MSEAAAKKGIDGQSQAVALRTFATGIHGLDRLLGGGVPLYATVIVAGAPGTGKTILTQQILFGAARRGQRALSLSTLSESPMKAARYQGLFDFFDAEKFGREIVYADVGQIIRQQGLVKALEEIADLLRGVQPAVAVIDSFKALHDLAPSTADIRAFIFDFAVELAAVQSTSFWVGEYAEEDLTQKPEMAVADGIIWLTAEMRNNRFSRQISVPKMRGMAHSTSAQGFAIDRRGIEVFMTAVPERATGDQDGRVTKTGLPALDEILRGGLPRGYPVLVSGEAGTGKTTLGLQFLNAGATDYGEKGVFFSFEEPPEQVIADARGLGWDFRRLVESGMLQVRHTPLAAIEVPQQIFLIQQILEQTKASRAVVDSLTTLMSGLSDPEMIRYYVYQLTEVLKGAGCTALITSDPVAGSGAISHFGVEESIVDGVIVLKVARERRGRVRYLEVYKMRGVGHETGDNAMRITKRGIEVFPRIEEVTS